jgi:hypothetical protein
MCNTLARWSRAAGEFGIDTVAESFTRLVSHGLFGKPGAKPRAPRKKAAA